MEFYASKCHNSLNGKEFMPENYAGGVCVSPHYKTTIKNDNVKILLDSGAFQDVSSDKRLSFADALNRQLQYEYDLTEDHRPVNAIVSYDRLVDEQLGEQGQFKKRVTDEESGEYVKDTIEAARYLASMRHHLKPRQLVLSCQGVTTKQYVKCAETILEFAEPGDILGLGGFCIISRSKQYEAQFYEVITQLFPLMAKKGIYRAHIFGVGKFKALLKAEAIAKPHGIMLSYDTSSYEVNGVFGSVFNPEKTQLNAIFAKKDKYAIYEPAKLAEFNIKAVSDYWASLNGIWS